MKDGSVLSIYSHWNNYPEYNGRILRTHYNTREKVEELIDSGDCSSIWTDKDWNGNEWIDCKYKALTYSLRAEDCPPRLDLNLMEYLGDGEEYAYLFTNGEWVCYDLHETPKMVEIPFGALTVYD